MAEKMNGLSLDFIIHPGETLKEVLEEKQMSQEELAIRTGFSPKHVSEVVNGKKGISPSFARSLEYVFGIPTSFWINLQGIYDKEMLEYKEQEEIDENEVEIVKKLKELFAECGVVFQVVKNFAGAPVQGFIRKNDNKIILSMTIRRAFADEFWFTLFHEIGHLLNGDIAGNQFIDYADSKSNMEEKADEFASNALINEEEYRKFVESGNLTEEKIRKFSKEQNVKPFIVVGRIQRDQKDYKLFYNLKTRYKWE